MTPDEARAILPRIVFTTDDPSLDYFSLSRADQDAVHAVSQFPSLAHVEQELERIATPRALHTSSALLALARTVTDAPSVLVIADYARAISHLLTDAQADAITSALSKRFPADP